MSNLKRKEFFSCVTGDSVDGNKYGIDAEIFKKADNVDMVFDSRGSFLGIITCRGKFINGGYTCKRGIHEDKYYQFNLDNTRKDEIELYYLLGFNKDYSKLEHAWRISTLDFMDEYYILIGIIGSYTYNTENMKEYEITKMLRYIDFHYLDSKQENKKSIAV